MDQQIDTTRQTSGNKQPVVIPTDDNTNSGLFSERLCDDLCEVLLQFLPIEDKLMFECVSKQFQRTVYQRQHHLNLKSFFKRFNLRKRRKPMEEYKAFESIVKKCPNIKSFEDYFTNDSQIDLILKYCNNLNEFDSDLLQISDQKRDSFAAKFGQKLISINTTKEELDWVQESFPRIKILNVMFKLNSDQLVAIRFRNLKKLSICSSDSEDIQTFEQNFIQFIDNNKRLTHFNINFDFKFANSFEVFFKNIINLNCLESLQINSKCDITPITIGLRQLSQNLKLKSLSVGVSINSLPNIMNFLSEVNKFKALERLGFCLNLKNIEDVNLFEDNFNGLQSLTHLSINISNIGQNIDNNILHNIENSLPGIRSLKLTGIWPGYLTAISLSRLQYLEYLQMNCNKDIRDLIIKLVINNCKKIKTIDIKID